MRIAEIFVLLKKSGFEKHDDDVRFHTEIGNTAVSRMCNEKFAK